MIRRLTALLAALLLAAAAKPRVRIGADLDDVVDSEETDEWRAWGKRKEAKKIEGVRSHAQRRGGGPRRA